MAVDSYNSEYHCGQFQLPSGEICLVSFEDYEYVRKHKWYSTGKYIVRYVWKKDRPDNSPRLLKMHRDLLKPENGQYVDHINGNGFDNRRCNIRLCTPSQNAANRKPKLNGKSKYMGVSMNNSKSKPWHVKVGSKCIGTYADEIEAAKAYDAAAKQIHGEFCYLNFPTP